MAIPLTYSLRSIAVRKGSSAMAVGGIALVVIVFVTLLSLAAGFRRVVETSGSPDNVIVLRKGADAELQSQVLRETARVISELPLVEEEDGQKLIVFESVIILSRPKQGGGETNVTIRGTTPDRPLVHSEVRLTEGRWLTPGSDEAVLGVGPGPPPAERGHWPDDHGRAQQMAHRRAVFGRRQCARIGIMDGRRPAPERVPSRWRISVGVVPRQGQCG